VIETQDKPTARQEQSKSGGEPEDTREACVQNLGRKMANCDAITIYLGDRLATHPSAVTGSSQMSPIAAYDALAPYYSSLLESRKPYLKMVEAIVIAHSGAPSSMLDVGSGNGVRALRIAAALNIGNIVLVEPSEAMRRQSAENSAVWKQSVAEVPETNKFDLITCLWNVLGHLEGAPERASMLSRLRALLSPTGRLFLDVNHRYNAAAYGWRRTLLRMVHDLILPSEKNGDVIASWQAGSERIRTRGHVFTQRELSHLFKQAGLKVKARWIVDYETGQERRFSFSGNLLYELST
jgi:SAM-dependent methyltransferase